MGVWGGVVRGWLVGGRCGRGGDICTYVVDGTRVGKEMWDGDIYGG